MAIADTVPRFPRPFEVDAAPYADHRLDDAVKFIKGLTCLHYSNMILSLHSTECSAFFSYVAVVLSVLAADHSINGAYTGE